MANESDNSPVPKVNRPVKPRKKRSADKPVIAVDKGQVLLESGEIFPTDDLPVLIRSLPSSIVVSHHFGATLRFLNEVYKDNDLWQYRLSPIESTSWSPERKRKAVMKDCIISFFGFKGERKQRGHYHYPISPETFCLKSIHELRASVPGGRETITKLTEWAIELRDYCVKQDLNLSPTSGGIAAQLLRDDRFYPSARRKVPKITNAKGREKLPGNYYKLYKGKTAGENVRPVAYKAAYLDQISAHHTAALTLEFPNANTLRRYGRYSTLQDKSFAKVDTPKYREFIACHGLFYLAIETPRFFDTSFPLPECGEGGEYKRGYFYSNEIPYLLELGVRIRHIIACWVSPDRDAGLNRYAEWALQQVAGCEPSAKPWLKPLLLSTYGVLAAKPRHLEYGYRQAKNGETKEYPCGSGFITVQAKRTSKEIEPLMSNVIHRGMIEAETRLRSLRFARGLTLMGYNILAIYADSIFVDSSKDLPLIGPPWRVQEYLSNLRFQSATHFSSHEVTKQPGGPVRVIDMGVVPPRPRAKRKGRDGSRTQRL